MSFGVIFDMDGVIVRSEEAHWVSWRAVALRRGIDLTYETFLSCFGRVNADCIRIMLGEGIGPEESRSIAQAKESAFRDAIRASVPLAAGTRDLLTALRAAGAKMAVGSSAPPENVALILDAGGIREFFSAAIDGDQVTRGKPAPDVFLKAGSSLSIDPARCAVIEDAPAGIRAARAAGMTAIGVATTHTRDQLLEAGAHDVLPELADLSPTFIEHLIATANTARRP
ncbi:MAG TPA: HAD family phosphatase [Phycisphaerales bacterium]|nr:HAD family phosphatase [Phycisphaerales bacterium]